VAFTGVTFLLWEISALLLTGANCGVSKQNEISGLGILTLSVLPHHFIVSRCSTAKRVRVCVLTVLPHHFLFSRCGTANRVRVCILTVLPHHLHFSRCSVVRSVHITILTVLPHQFRFSLYTTAHSVHIHILIVFPQHRFDVSRYRGTQHAPTIPHGIYVRITYGILCKSAIRNTGTLVNLEGVSNTFNEKIYLNNQLIIEG
jgi:hypothetical protein